MIQISKKTKLLIYTAAIAMVIAVGVISFTNVSAIEAVNLGGTAISGWSEKFTLKENASVLKQPYNKMTQEILKADSALKVEVSYSWPHTLNLELNSITPVCLVLNKDNGRILGLDKNCRVVPLTEKTVDWERPVFTNVKNVKLYRVCMQD